jgi:hypothetical protein
MFSNDEDPQSVQNVRESECDWIERWIKEHHEAKPHMDLGLDPVFRKNSRSAPLGSTSTTSTTSTTTSSTSTSSSGSVVAGGGQILPQLRRWAATTVLTVQQWQAQAGSSWQAGRREGPD